MAKEPIRIFCDKCGNERQKTQIAYVHFTDRTPTGQVTEKRILRVCRECFEKDLKNPIKAK